MRILVQYRLRRFRQTHLCHQEILFLKKKLFFKNICWIFVINFLEKFQNNVSKS